MTASQAASKVRNAIKKTGTNPKGLVSVRNTDFTTELEIDLRYLSEDDRDNVCLVIDEIEESDFSFNVDY